MAVFTRTLWRQADSWGNAADPGPVCAAQPNEQWLVVRAGKTNINSLLSPLMALQLNFPFAGRQRVDLLEDFTFTLLYFTKADVRSHVFQRLDNILLCLPPPFSFLNENHLVQPLIRIPLNWHTGPQNMCQWKASSRAQDVSESRHRCIAHSPTMSVQM